jgi:hypothetical protein
MPPKLTHHEINSCLDAVLSVLDRRKAQLGALRAGNKEVLAALDAEGEVPCEDEDYNVDPAIAVDSLSKAISRLETLHGRLAEILTYCEKCGTKDETVGPVYPDTLWQCDDCRERA